MKTIMQITLESEDAIGELLNDLKAIRMSIENLRFKILNVVITQNPPENIFIKD